MVPAKPERDRLAGDREGKEPREDGALCPMEGRNPQKDVERG